jgi:hypothetical protein
MYYRTLILGSSHGPQYPTFTQAQSGNCHIYQNIGEIWFLYANQFHALNTSLQFLNMRVVPALKFQLLCIEIDKEIKHILDKERVFLLFESMQVM